MIRRGNCPAAVTTVFVSGILLWNQVELEILSAFEELRESYIPHKYLTQAVPSRPAPQLALSCAAAARTASV